MAELRELQGLACAVHAGSKIFVGASGKNAICGMGCKTAELKAYAASLNGNTPKIESPPRVIEGPGVETAQSEQKENAVKNGKLQGPYYERRVNLPAWRQQVFSTAYQLLRTSKTYQERRPAAEFLDTLLEDMRAGIEVLVSQGHPPPIGLSETDIQDECDRAAKMALEDWAGGIDLDRALPIVQKNGAAAVTTISDIHPDDLLKPLNLGELYDLCDEWDRQPWVWEGILPRSSLSLIVGKSETGKSTLIYALIYSIIRGLTFLGRHCEEGRVLYLAGDPMSEVVAGKTFRALDLGRDDGVMVLPGAMVNNPSAMVQLKRIVADFKPSLIVGDTLAATVALDTDKYGQSYSSQQPLSKLARESGANFLMAHHSQKAAVDSYNVVDAALGSVGVAAVASTRMVTRLYRRGKDKFHTFEMSNLRIGQPIDGEWIIQKLDNGLVDLGGLWGSRAVELDRAAIMTALEDQTRDAWVSGRTLFQEVTPKPKYGQFMKALRDMIKLKLVETDKKNGKGGGMVYRKSTASPETPPLYEQN